MKKYITDERINQEKLRVDSIAFKILFFSLIVDVFFRILILKENFNNLFDITTIILILSLYILIEYSRKGLFCMIKNHGKKRVFINNLILILLFYFSIYLINPTYSLIRVLIYTLIVFIIYSIIMTLFNKIYKDKNN